jgi:cytochrome bd ubiquinol oxidase subunit I
MVPLTLGLGLWIFGWGRLPKRLHLAALWVAVAGSIVSAFFIIVANSWTQHPVGVTLVDGRPVLTDIWAVLTNNTALTAYSHTLTGALAVGAGFLVGISRYQLWQRRRDDIDTVDARGRVIVGERLDIPGRDRTDHSVWIKSLRVGAVVAIVGFGGVALTGDLQAKLMFEQQPLKMAAAGAACQDGTSFSVLSIGNLGSQSCNDVAGIIEIPGILSFLAHGDFTTEIKGVNTLIPEYHGEVRHESARQPALRRACRPGDQLPAAYGGHVLGLPADDRLRHSRGGICGTHAVADPQGYSAQIEDHDGDRVAQHRGSLRRQYFRMGVYRDG